MTRFRPCIDLHEGRVKQIVGGTLTDSGEGPRTNFVSDQPPTHFATLYRNDGLEGGHVIKLGPGNEEAALEALQAYPGGLQVGGGITPENSALFLDAGATHVIVTSFLFSKDGRFLQENLDAMLKAVGKDKLVLDLSCRADDEGGWTVAMNRWQTRTDLKVTAEVLTKLAGSCDEFLIHAADVEGLCGGIDSQLVEMLGKWAGAPVTYAGGAKSLDDLHEVESAGKGAVDLAIGSALDIFGGSLIRYEDCVAFNQRDSKQ